MADESGTGRGSTGRAAEKIELNGLFAQMLGVWYPKDYVVAAIGDEDGTAAVEALLAAGFGRNAVHLHDSERVAGLGAAIYQQRSPLQRAGAAISRAVTDEGLMSQEYIEDAQSGASLIAVRTSEPGLVEEARRVLSAHGAWRIRFYGDRSVTDL